MAKVTIGNCVLYHGDTMDILPRLIKEKAHIDCLVCDPPYKLTAGGGNPSADHKKMAGIFNNDKYDNKGQIVECEIDWQDFMPLFYDILPAGHAYIMCNNRHIQNMLNAAQDAGFKFHNMLVWDKITATANRWYMKNCEFTGLFYKGKAQFINDCSSKQLIKCQQIDDSIHPTEKPVPLMQHYICNSTNPLGVVIDPFMGSGTTGVSCIKAGRKFIGIEKDKSYFDECVRRIKYEEKHHQVALF